MPAYDFKCESCQKEFTVQVSISEKAKTTCVYCGSKEIKQQFKRINLGGGISGGKGSGGSCSSGSCSSCAGC